jgi:hypothetical protein
MAIPYLSDITFNNPENSVGIFFSTDTKVQYTGASSGDLTLAAEDQVRIRSSASSSDELIAVFSGDNIWMYEDVSFLQHTTHIDNKEARFGTGSDLKIFHDGSHSYIQDAGTGELRLAANVFRVLNANASETMIYAEQDGKVQLRFNESTKFETTNTGINVTGNMLATGQVLCDTNTTTPTGGEAVFYKSSAGAVLSGYQAILETGSAGSRQTALTINNSQNATFAGDITTNGDIIIDNSSGDPFLKLKTTAQEWVARIDQSDSEKFQIRNVTGTTTALSIDTSSNATFAGNILMGNTVVNPASGFADQTGIGLKYSTTVPEIQVSSDDTALQLGRTSTGGNGIIMAMRYASNTIHTFSTNAVSIGTNATFAGNVTTGSTISLTSDGSTSHTNSRIILNSTQSNARGVGVFMHNTNDDQEFYMGVPYAQSFDKFMIAHKSTASHSDSTAEFANALMSIDTSGNATFAGDISLADNKEIKLGAGTDLKLYSNGTDGYVVAPVDDLVLQAADNVFIYAQGGEDGIIVRGNDRVDIFYNGAERLRTTASGITVSNSGNDTTAKVVMQGNNNTGTPGQVTSASIEHRGEHLKTVITHNGSDVITIGTGTQTTFAGDVSITGSSTTALTIGDTTGDTFQKMIAGSASGIQFQLWHGTTQTATINSNTTNIFAVYDGSASGTNVFNIADGGNATFAGDVLAPIFYDSNNTTYFLNPAGTATALNVAGAIQLPDSKAIVWAGNNILSHNGTQTYIGDNVSSSTVTITGGAATFGGDVIIPQGAFVASQTSTTNPVARFTNTGVNDYNFTFPNNSTIQLGSSVGTDLIFKLANAGAGDFNLDVGGDAAFTGNVTVTGDLSVTGTTTTVNQTNLDVSDNIIGLNRGASSNANDSGIIIERGSTGNNAAIIWDESNDRFVLGLTTATPSSTGSVAIASTSNLAAGNLDVNTISGAATTLTSTTPALLVLNPTASNYGGINFQYGGANKGAAMYNSGMMVFGGESGTHTRLQAGGQYGLSVDKDTRNVSIGSTSDTGYKLGVNGSLYAAGNTVLAGTLTVQANANAINLTCADGNVFLNVNHTGNESWHFKAESASGSTDYVSIGASGGGKVKIYEGGAFEHQGLSMSTGTDVDQIKEFTMTFQLSANTWTDTGINGTDLATGTYAVQVYVDDYGVGGNHYTEYYSGMMSWYSTNTNNAHVDELVLHRAGHAPNNGDIQLRTERTLSADTNDLMLQVKHNIAYTANLDNTGGKSMRFKFRRLI